MEEPPYLEALAEALARYIEWRDFMQRQREQQKYRRNWYRSLNPPRFRNKHRPAPTSSRPPPSAVPVQPSLF